MQIEFHFQGMMSPSSGTASLNGFDIRNGLPSARKFLGLCPQYNPLFDNLTVMEHVKFFCQVQLETRVSLEKLCFIRAQVTV